MFNRNISDLEEKFDQAKNTDDLKLFEGYLDLEQITNKFYTINQYSKQMLLKLKNKTLQNFECIKENIIDQQVYNLIN